MIQIESVAWGELLLTNSQPRSGSNWTDDGSVRQRRELKHRAKEETRSVPIHPELAKLLRDHLAEFGTGSGGRIFTLPRGGIVTDRAYLKVFHRACAEAFTNAEATSLLALRVPTNSVKSVPTANALARLLADPLLVKYVQAVGIFHGNQPQKGPS